MKTNLRRATPGLCCLPIGLALAGCRSQAVQDAAEQAARQALKREATKAKDSITELGDVLSQGATLSGHDDKGRFLWSVGAKQIRAQQEKTDDKGVVLSPRRADLSDARATLYREGRPDSTFRAAHIALLYTPRGVMMEMTGGVQARTSGVLPGRETGNAAKSKTVSGVKAAPPSGANAKSAMKPGAQRSAGVTKIVGRGPISLQAPRVNVDVKARRVRADNGVEMTQGKTRVQARRLAADSALAVARLSGDVRASAPQGTLTATNAVWNWRTGRALATGKITLSHDGTTLTGTRLDADTNGARGVLSGGPTTNGGAAGGSAGGVLAVAAQGRARAANIAYNWERGTIAARGGVTLTKPEGTLQAAQLDADDKLQTAVASGAVTLRKGDITLRAARVEAFDKLERAVATGEVTLIRPDARLRADRAEAWLNDERVVATGGVSLTRPDSTLRASRVEAWLRDNRALATGGVMLVRGDLTLRAARADATNASGAPNAPAAPSVTASGDVVAQSGAGSVRAARVTWSGAVNKGDNSRIAGRGEGRIVADGGVTLRRDGNEMRGARLESDDAFRQATLTGDVGGRLAGGAALSAGTVLWRSGATPAASRVLARDGVSVRRDQIRLRADNLDARGDGSHATLRGNVVLTSDDGVTARAPLARYDKAAGKIYASGGVQLDDPKWGRQRGRVMVADLNLKKVTLTPVTGSFSDKLLKNSKLFR